jgi:hypothetical protein
MLFSSVGPYAQGVYLRLFRTIPDAASALEAVIGALGGVVGPAS